MDSFLGIGGLNPLYVDISIHLIGALTAGGMIGLERSFHGRAAGFRTHALVCLASSLLMLVTMYQDTWLIGITPESVRTDPTRMAQGIMTGIGFLGAGVIYKESLTVRGLTTAASIWMTAAIGILFGIGFYFAAIIGTILTLSVLSLFLYIQDWMPALNYTHYTISFDRNDVMPEHELRALLHEHGYSMIRMGYGLEKDGQIFVYETVLQSRRTNNNAVLAQTLRKLPSVRGFSIAPSGE